VEKIVKSSMIKRIASKDENNETFESTLEVEFNNGAVWHYFKVPNKKINALAKAESVGKYFNAEIRGKYEEYKIKARD